MIALSFVVIKAHTAFGSERKSAAAKVQAIDPALEMNGVAGKLCCEHRRRLLGSKTILSERAAPTQRL